MEHRYVINQEVIPLAFLTCACCSFPFRFVPRTVWSAKKYVYSANMAYQRYKLSVTYWNKFLNQGMNFFWMVTLFGFVHRFKEFSYVALNKWRSIVNATLGSDWDIFSSYHLPLPWANIIAYFSLRAKCWLRGGVGGQFPRNLNWSKKSNLQSKPCPFLTS